MVYFRELVQWGQEQYDEMNRGKRRLTAECVLKYGSPSVIINFYTLKATYFPLFLTLFGYYITYSCGQMFTSIMRMNVRVIFGVLMISLN